MADEVIGNGAIHMKIQYCGGYRPNAQIFIERVDKDFGNRFTYHLFGDKETTGNFEVTIFHKADLFGEGHVAWSKKTCGAFPYADGDNWCNFTMNMYGI